MAAQSHYEINVALNGKHLFATAPYSCRDRDDAKFLMAYLKPRFPESEGFQITCKHWKVSGERIEFD